MLDADSSPIFLFGSGQRCGTTLLQRFLSSHPDMLIWGEHDGVLAKMFAQFDRLHEWQNLFGHHFDKYSRNGPLHHFIANMNPPRHIVHDTQIELVRSYWQRPAHALGKRYWGFKEVLYGADMALQLRRLFPGARVIYITRHVFDCFVSLLHEERLKPGETYVPLKEIWTRERTIEALNYWVRINRSFIETPGIDDSWVFRLKYEQLIHDPVGISKKLTEWLCLQYEDFNHEVFHRKIYTDRHNWPDERPKIQWSDLSAEEYALLTADEVMEVTRVLNYDMPQPKRKK